jgi:hypothetical protein
MNPKHMSWKTSKENSQDTIRHGKWNHGETASFAKLTREQVREIRKLKGTMSLGRIGELFGVTKSAVSSIHVGRSWAWLE